LECFYLSFMRQENKNKHIYKLAPQEGTYITPANMPELGRY